MPVLKQQPSAAAPWPPLPSNDPKRRQWIEYPVGKRKDESFYTIAREKGLAPEDLVRYNFLTNDPKVINYYLEKYVGCMNPDGSGFNYTFFGAANGKIYIPVEGTTKPTPKPGEPLPPDPVVPPGLGVTYDIAKDLKLGKRYTPNVMYEFTVSVKGKAQVFDAGIAAGVKLSAEKIGGAFTRKLGDDWQAGVAVSFDRKFVNNLTSAGGGSLQKRLKESLEASLKKTFDLGPVAIDLEPGVKFSDMPFFFKVTAPMFQGQVDLGPYLDMAGPCIVKFAVNITFAVNVGPSPALLERLGVISAPELAGAGAVIGLMVGFIGFGAWYGGHAAERGDMIGKFSHYVSGYWYWLTGSYTTIGREPEMQKLFDLGESDARTDAIQSFAPSEREARYYYLAALQIASSKRYPELKGAPTEAMRKLVTEMLAARLKERYGVDYPA